MENLNNQIAPRVFLVEPNNRFVIADAETRGTLSYLSVRCLNPFNPDTAKELIYRGFQEQGFNLDRDYLIMTGNSLVLAMALSVACVLYPKIQLLLFDSRTSSYCERLYDSPRVQFEKE